MFFDKASSRCALALALVIMFAISIAHCGSDTVDQSFFHMRPRLGHFQHVEGYMKIYEEYFENVIKLTDRSVNQIDINDWRNVRPTGERCINFLQAFQVKGYKLHKPFDMIPLDSCLDWLADTSEEKKIDLDKFNSVTKEEHDRLLADARFKNLSASTGFKGDKIPNELKEKLHEYFARLLKIHADNPKNGCHSLWLEAYNDFIEDIYYGKCEEEHEEECVPFGLDGSDQDSYLNLIVDSTKQAASNCYNHVTQRQMAGLISAAYEQESKSGLYSKLKTAATGKVAKQSDSMRWSREMINILQLVTGSDPEKPIHLPLVVQALHKLKNNEPETVEKFTDAISQYANQNVNLKDTGDDPDGRARFGHAMTKLCKPYIDPKLFLSQTGGSTLWEDDPNAAKRPFEFYNLIYSLVRLTNYPSIFGITKEKFEEDVLANHWESLYLATFSCQIISTTWGQLDYDTNQDVYKVYLRPNFEVTIEDWPIVVINQRLGSQKVESEEKPLAPTPPAEADAPPSSGKRSFLPKPKLPKRLIPEIVPAPQPAPQPSAQHPPRPRFRAPPIPKPSVESKPEFQNPLPTTGDSRPTVLKFQNPLKRGVKTSVTSLEDFEADKSTGTIVPLDSDSDEAPKRSVTPPTAFVTPPSDSHRISTESAEFFKKLHGRYPDNYAPPSSFSPQTPRSVGYQKWFEQDEDLEKLAAKAEPVSNDWNIPVAFDFNKNFVPGQSKFGSSAAKPKTNQWAEVSALSF